MKDLQIFKNEEFGTVRTIEQDGKVLFCGTDIATALGYSKPYNAISMHCRYALKQGTPHPQSPSKQIEMTFIPEGDVYRLIAHSKLPGAEKFERWVFDEVLPSIRKTGGYIAGQESLSDDELLTKALLVAQRKIEERNKLIASQKQIIGELTPKAEYGKYVDDRNFDYGVYADDRNQAYSEYLDAVQQAQWGAQFGETVKQNEIGNQQWEQSFGETVKQNAIGNQQWEQSFAEQQRQNEIANSQWQQSFNESKRQYEEAKASASGGSGGSGGSGSKDAALEHVASMSSAEVVETMQGYSADGDNTGLAAFLDDCVASGRLTEEQADEYYEKYRKGGHTITDTTVPKTPVSGASGSVGGQISYKY